MSNQLRFRKGQMELIRVRVDSDTVIEAGDLVYLDTDDAKPAAAFTWSTNLSTTQGNFAAAFLGIAQETSAAGETNDITVDISSTSVYEFDVAASTFEVGTPLGLDETSSALSSHVLEKVASGTAAIARAVEYKAHSSTLLKVSFASAFHTSSSNVNANIG
jgi:hypothetical protein